MKTINVCMYTRVSRDIMDYNRQISDIKDHCQKHNYNIVKEFSEKETGRNRERKMLTELLEYCKENRNDISFVLVSELSRLGRTGQVIFTIETLNEYKIGLISLKETLKTLNDDRTVNYTSGLVMSILSSINSYELETTKYRSKSGLMYSAKQGNWTGGKMLPYGYMREPDGKKLVINPEEKPVIEDIFRLYCEGNGTQKIAAYLNAKSVPTRTGVRWRDKVVYDIIMNPLYYGQRLYYKDRKESKNKNKPERKGQSFFIPAPAIISEETYKQANKIRASNYNKAGINRTYDYLLDERLITCGVCGKSYFAHRREDLRDNAYKCISIRYQENCGNTSININKLEFAVQYVFLRDMYKLLKFDESKNDKNLSDIKTLKAELKKIENRRNKLVELYTFEKIDMQQFDKDSDALKTEENRINQLIAEAQSKIVNVKSISFGALYEMKDGKYEINKPVVSKEQIRQVVKQIVINKDPKILTTNRQDKTVKVDIISVTNQTVTIYLSQRADFFLYNGKKVKYPGKNAK
ncbi:MAG TPA: recombinase family protein [Bacteroidales bacterium]|nr:recombinase family protein [Bacteroidales bacterium]